MISNERSWPGRQESNLRPYYQNAATQTPRPFVQEDKLKTAEIQIERKLFFLTLKENPRGRFLRISEEVGTNRSSIIIPATGLREFQKLLADMIKTESEMPGAGEPPAAGGLPTER